MDPETLTRTRVSLHGVAELVLAGPQYDASGDIRLRVTPGGFGTVAAPDLRVEGTRLVCAGGSLPLAATTYAELAAAAGVTQRALRDVYAVGPDVDADDPVEVDEDACRLILASFARADDALAAFAPDVERVLWPEHFDLGISLDEVNYGVSPGDEHVAEPYAYVGPWAPRVGPFWTASFGATRTMAGLPDAAAVERFFREGALRAATDPRATTE